MEDYELMVKSYIEKEKGNMRFKDLSGKGKEIIESNNSDTETVVRTKSAKCLADDHLRRNLTQIITPNYMEYMSNRTNGGPVDKDVRKN
jgi:hypothetical protein